MKLIKLVFSSVAYLVALVQYFKGQDGLPMLVLGLLLDISAKQS